MQRSGDEVLAFSNRYQKNCSSLSDAETLTLGKKRVLVVGSGGLGGHVIELLARSGVGILRVVDGDRFEESNLNRQLFCTEETLGLKKVEAAQERIGTVNSDVTVEAFATYLDADNADELVQGCDCAVDALDSIESRQVLRSACQTGNVPLVHGAIAGWFGQVGVILPADDENILTGVDGSGSFADGERSMAGAEIQLGNLAATAATVASIQAAEVLKVLLQRPDTLHQKLLMVDLQQASFETIELS